MAKKQAVPNGQFEKELSEEEVESVKELHTKACDRIEAIENDFKAKASTYRKERNRLRAEERVLREESKTGIHLADRQMELDHAPPMKPAKPRKSKNGTPVEPVEPFAAP